jgi:exodeoxyribonuclease VII small subunit
MDSEELTYKLAITELEAIVKDIESGEVDVDALAEKVKRATELIKFCNDRLKGTQDAVNKILLDVEATDKDDDSDE